MKGQPLRFVLLAGLLFGVLNIPRQAEAENWPGWRGPRADGTSLEVGVPTEWDIVNATWKTAVPGVGHASPIVWKDRIFTATAVPEKLDRMLVCFERATGRILWQQVVATDRSRRLTARIVMPPARPPQTENVST